LDPMHIDNSKIVKEVMETAGKLALDSVNKMADLPCGHLSAELQSQFRHAVFMRLQEQIKCTVWKKLEEVKIHPGTFVAEARSMGMVGAEVWTGDIASAGALGVSMEVGAVLLVSSLILNAAIQQSGDLVSEEFKCLSQRGVDAGGAAIMGAFSVYEFGVGTTCGYEWLTGATAKAGMGAALGCPVATAVAITGGLGMGYCAIKNAQRAMVRKPSLSKTGEGQPTSLKGYFQALRNLVIIGNGAILRSLLAHHGKTPEEIDDFLDDTPVEDLLSQSENGKISVSNLRELADLCRLPIAEGCDVWRFGRGLFEEPDVIKLLAFEAADAVIIMGEDDVTRLDMQLLMYPENNTFLHTLIVKDVRNHAGLDRLQNTLLSKLRRHFGLKPDQKIGFKPNWLGLLGPNLDCLGGHALRYLVVPPKHDPRT